MLTKIKTLYLKFIEWVHRPRCVECGKDTEKGFFYCSVDCWDKGQW